MWVIIHFQHVDPGTGKSTMILHLLATKRKQIGTAMLCQLVEQCEGAHFKILLPCDQWLQKHET